MWAHPTRPALQCFVSAVMALALVGVGINWLQVSGAAERPQIHQRVRQQLHAIVPLLDAFKS
jgi:hypothetical protein